MMCPESTTPCPPKPVMRISVGFMDQPSFRRHRHVLVPELLLVVRVHPVEERRFLLVDELAADDLVLEVDVDVLRLHKDEIAFHLGFSDGYVEQPLREYDYGAYEALHAFAAHTFSKELAGVGLLIELTDISAGLLRMGVVFPEFRNIGIYRELVKVRLHRAFELGMDVVVTHALVTSADLLVGMGMERHSQYSVFKSP